MALSNVRVEWAGLKELEIWADVLPATFVRDNVGPIYQRALEPVQREMRRNLPGKRTGNLWRSIGITIGRSKYNVGSVTALVGPRRARFDPDAQGWHSHLIEKGTRPHKIKAGIGKLMPVFAKGSSGPVDWTKEYHHPGSQAFHPFSRAIESTYRQVYVDVERDLDNLWDTTIKIAFRKYGKGKPRRFISAEERMGRDVTKMARLTGRYNPDHN